MFFPCICNQWNGTKCSFPLRAGVHITGWCHAYWGWVCKKVGLGVSPKTTESNRDGRWFPISVSSCMLLASPQGLSQFHDDWKGWSFSMMVDFSAEISLYEDKFAKTSILFHYCWFCVHHWKYISSFNPISAGNIILQKKLSKTTTR